MQVKLFIDDVNYYQFAAIVEDEIVTQDFSALNGQPVTLATRRSFTPAESVNRLEIGVNHSFIHPITLDCYPLSDNRLQIVATCIQDRHQPIFEKLLNEIRRYWTTPEVPSAPPPPTTTPASLPTTTPSPPPSSPLKVIPTPPTSSPPSPTVPPTSDPPQPEPAARPRREINLSTAQRVAEAKYHILSSGHSISTACNLANVSRKTFRTWKDNEVVERLLQEMLEHPPEE